MTAPSPAGLSPLLDQLDEARAKATPGPWESDGALVLPGYWGDTPPVLARTNDHSDAALIVAAVNALPQLTAALRAVEALADEWENDDHPEGWNYSEYLRSTLTAALTPGADTAGATA